MCSCEFQWYPGDWEPCSATCGSHGLQNREIYCIPNSVSSYPEVVDKACKTVWKYIMNPNKCSGTPPSNTRACNRVPCVYNWQFTEWSEVIIAFK